MGRNFLFGRMERRLFLFLFLMASCSSLQQPFLVQFRDRFASFRIAEFLSVADALVGHSNIQFHAPNVDGTRDDPPQRIDPRVYSYGSRPPVLLWLTGLSASEAARVCDRCVLVRGLSSDAEKLDTLLASLLPEALRAGNALHEEVEALRAQVHR